MVLLRMLADQSPYTNVLEKIKEKCNKIMFSTSIDKEWRTKAYIEGMSVLTLIRKLEELKQIEKLKKCKKISLDKARKLVRSKKCRKPDDRYDLKFVEAAMAEKAILITRDFTLLDLNPYKCGKVYLKIMSPEDYLARAI